MGIDAVGSVIKHMNQIQLTVDGSAAVVVELGEHSKEIGLLVEPISATTSQTLNIEVGAMLCFIGISRGYGANE